jgi:hypothetical protein
MSTNKDLFKEAIADAKQVREAALANAKAALEEALTPKLQSMISARLQEMDLDEEEVDEIDFMKPKDSSDEMQDQGYGNIEQGYSGKHDVNEEDLEEDFDLSAILAELGDEEDSVNEAKEKDEEKEKMDEAEEEEAGEEEEIEDETSEEEPTEEPAEEATAEDKITDLTVDQLKDIIKDIISSELEAEEYETPGGEEAEMGGEEMSMDMGDMGGEEEEVNLEELLAELDALDEVEETESLNESAIADVLTALAGVAGMGLTGIAITKAQDALKSKNPELYAKLQGIHTSMSKQGVGMDMEEAKDEDEAMQYEAKKKLVKKDKKDEKDEMKEAIDTINTLRNELNETNLLNAKLLYVNKIFKAKNLTESQKLKVIASFDKATTPKQAKELFESIQSSNFGASKKSQIKESLGFASKAAGVAPKNSANTIVESNDVIARMQKLANIIK